MLTHFQTRIGPLIRNNPLYSVSNLKTLKMAVVTQSNSKRHTCPSCSKPASLCICSRIRTLRLENSVSVTILQHKLETKHPLNSVRIAKLGLKNLTVATVFDVNFEARFVIRVLEPGHESGPGQIGVKSSDLDQVLIFEETQKPVFEDIDGFSLGREHMGHFEFIKNSSSFIDTNGNSENKSGGLNFEQNLDLLTSDDSVLEAESELTCKESNGAKVVYALDTSRKHLVRGHVSNEAILPGFDPIGAVSSVSEEPVISATIGKYGVVNDFGNVWMMGNDLQSPNFDQILACRMAVDELAKGFVVKKIQKRQLSGSMELEECEEFELEVPPGSVLLFPSDKAVGVDGLKAMDFEVKNLIVLDGTWAKANRMYKENPWLKLLPHLRLDLDKMSLYSEVRQQPKFGYLSTIESVVYGLKAVGDNPEGLDNLLDVFESMVGDQRRCKDERLSKEVSPE